MGPTSDVKNIKLPALMENLILQAQVLQTVTPVKTHGHRVSLIYSLFINLHVKTGIISEMMYRAVKV